MVAGGPAHPKPCGFHSRACLVSTKDVAYIMIFFSPVLTSSYSFLMWSEQYICKIFLRHLLTNTCRACSFCFMCFQVSHAYSNTVFTLELKIRSFVGMVMVGAL